MRIISLIAALAALPFAGAAPAATAAGKLTATVGPGFTITMNAKTVKPGAYTITVRDRSNIHDFSLIGPGVNKTTGVTAVKTYTWKVALKRGTYRFVCDPHKTIMKGTLRVS